MRVRIRWIFLVCLLACGGCGGCGQKSTSELIEDLRPSASERNRIVAARTFEMQHGKGDAARVVPALIKALKDKDADVRWAGANGLGYYGDKAREAIPALQEAEHDRDARIREAAGRALSRIDPTKFEDPAKRGRK
jgi:hypothetical protein